VSVEVEERGPREYRILLHGEDHTMGSLLQYFLLRDPRVELAYYRVPHPLQDAIEVYLKLKEDADPLQVLEEALDKVLEIIRDAGEKTRAALAEAGLGGEE